MLTEQEIQKIFSWLPYRQDWPVDRNQINDNITGYYGDLIKTLNQNKLFDTYYSEDGGLGNYLEFICYPHGQRVYNGAAILVCISLCAPIAAYGQIIIHKEYKSFGRDFFLTADTLALISDDKLIEIEKEIVSTLTKYNLQLVDKEFASRKLPNDVAESLMYENQNQGDQYLHGLFQKTD